MIDKREITPDILARITVLVFTKVKFGDALEKRICFDSLSASDLARLMMKDPYFQQSRSEMDCESLAHTVISYVVQKTTWHSGSMPEPRGRYDRGYADDKLNVFDLLLLTLGDLLVANQNRLECKYEEIFAWRLLVRYLGEELALSARHAQWDHEHKREKRKRYEEFAWPYVTGHNNKQLNMLLHRGVSDHHCHLNGSTPYFHVSWVNLMNRIENSQYQEKLRRMNPRKWSAEENKNRYRKHRKNHEPRDHYGELAQTRAAWIRLYLCERILKRTDAEKRYYDLANVRSYEKWYQLLMSRGRLQSELDSYIMQYGDKGDYILSMAGLQGTAFSTDYDILIGERWLYYRIFRDYVCPKQQRSLTDDDYHLFYLYLLLRIIIRAELVHVNDNMGFDNFQRIDRRKSYFLGDQESKRKLTRLAVNETLRKSSVHDLEVRIGPYTELIKELEGYVLSGEKESGVDRFLKLRTHQLQKDPEGREKADELQKQFYYVFHFLKRSDPSEGPDVYNNVAGLKTGRFCRHLAERNNYMRQAQEIIRFREKQPELACRVLGIDAASQELGCRPEVFAPVYRLLGDHQVPYGGYTSPQQKLPALGKTYHVAEDYPDIIDGLRSIDEAIRFLDYDCGDRLGHALALGEDIVSWYDRKHRAISLSIQDYLDNLAWLYHALSRCGTSDMNSLKERIVEDFDHWFRLVYLSNINEKDLRTRMEYACGWYRMTGEDHGHYQVHTCSFDITTYYHAWTLRGDDPVCYIDGFFKRPRGGISLQSQERCKICTNFPRRFEDRYVPEYSLLNYLYQFDYNIRREGSRRIKVDISTDYIRAVKVVQREMQRRIARMGISIETNPTSNVLIGSFREYGKHPILAFYNRGLPVNTPEEQDCAQIQVSINTDDSGVFYTDIETEYALLARSVEQLTDENDNVRFKKQDIYAWLDNIRIMGMDQTFRPYDK